jgi:hypothetical protein
MARREPPMARLLVQLRMVTALFAARAGLPVPDMAPLPWRRARSAAPERRELDPVRDLFRGLLLATLGRTEEARSVLDAFPPHPSGQPAGSSAPVPLEGPADAR